MGLPPPVLPLFLLDFSELGVGGWTRRGGAAGEVERVCCVVVVLPMLFHVRPHAYLLEVTGTSFGTTSLGADYQESPNRV